MKGIVTNVAANRKLARDFMDLPRFLQQSVLIAAELIDEDTPWEPPTIHSTTVDAFALASRTGKFFHARVRKAFEGVKLSPAVK